MLVDANSRIVRRDDLLSNNISGEMVLMNMERGEYCGLDPIATDIWMRLERPMIVGELARDLGEAYDGDPAAIMADLLALLRTLAEQDLIRQA